MKRIKVFLRAKDHVSFPDGSDGKESACNGKADSEVGKISWRREWQPTPVYGPEESHGQRSLVGCSPWGGKDSDMTKHLEPDI